MAAPYVGEIFRQLAKYKNLPYEAQFVNPNENLLVAIPAVKDLSVLVAVALLEKAGFFVEVAGEGETVTGSFPVRDTLVKAGEPVVLFT